MAWEAPEAHLFPMSVPELRNVPPAVLAGPACLCGKSVSRLPTLQVTLGRRPLALAGAALGYMGVLGSRSTAHLILLGRYSYVSPPTVLAENF